MNAVQATDALIERDQAAGDSWLCQAALTATQTVPVVQTFSFDGPCVIIAAESEVTVASVGNDENLEPLGINGAVVGLVLDDTDRLTDARDWGNNELGIPLTDDPTYQDTMVTLSAFRSSRWQRCIEYRVGPGAHTLTVSLMPKQPSASNRGVSDTIAGLTFFFEPLEAVIP
jgi:hypothetical protein